MVTANNLVANGSERSIKATLDPSPALSKRGIWARDTLDAQLHFCSRDGKSRVFIDQKDVQITFDGFYNQWIAKFEKVSPPIGYHGEFFWTVSFLKDGETLSTMTSELIKTT